VKHKRKPGAPITFGPEAKAAVIILKTEGKSDRHIGTLGSYRYPDGRVVRLPSRDTIDNWRNESHPQFDKEFVLQYTRACEDNLWSEHEKLHELNRRVEAGEIRPDAAKVIADNIKWDLARRMRHIFGDKSEVDLNNRVSGSVGVTVYLPDNSRKG